MRLTDKVAIVTGGAHGMGEAEARLFAAEGARVIVADILESEAEIVASDIRAGRKEAMAAKIDVTSESGWMDLITKVVETHGRLDILVNNAGISGSSVGDPDGLEGWHQIIAVNQTSVFLGTRLAAEQMAKTGGGSIIKHQFHYGVCRQHPWASRVSCIQRRGADLLQSRRSAVWPVRSQSQHRPSRLYAADAECDQRG